jgi:DNA polymerase-3 subunit alpha
MENIPSFCLRKNGKETVTYPHPLLERVLGETYGIMVYQEQVMEAAAGDGRLFARRRRPAAPGDGQEEARGDGQAPRHLPRGRGEEGDPAAVADEVFDLMEKFAGYGFNKSHAAAYSLLAYHTAWIKVHFPAEFFAANMTVELDNSDKLKALLVDARSFGVTIATPDINTGTYRFEPVSPTQVRYGLGAVKGTGPGRDRGDRRGAPRRRPVHQPVRLLRPGRPRPDQPPRGRGADQGRRLRCAASRALDAAGERRPRPRLGRHPGGPCRPGRPVRLRPDDDTHGASTQEPALVPAAPWSIKERLTLEKAALGFYLSGHLFDQSAAEVRRFAKVRLADVIDKREPMLLAGIVSDLRVVNGMRGRVAIFKLDDGSEAMEAVANEELLVANRELLKDDELVIVQGKVQPDRFSGGVRLNVQSVWDLAAARCRFGKYLRVEINGSVPPVAEVLREFPSRRLVTEHGEMPQGWRCGWRLLREHATGEIDLGDSARFYPSEAALARWNAAAAHGAPSSSTNEPAARGDDDADSAHRAGAHGRRGAGRPIRSAC